MMMGKEAKTEEVMKILENMKEYSFNTKEYNKILKLLQHNFQLDAALLIFQIMKNKGPPPDIQTYNIAINICEQKGLWQKALDIFDKMKQNRSQPGIDTIISLISLMKKERKAEKMMEIR